MITPVLEHRLVFNAPKTKKRWGSPLGWILCRQLKNHLHNVLLHKWISFLSLINASFPVDHGKLSIFGHSAGGHGTLICVLKSPRKCKSVSAFALVCKQPLPWMEWVREGQKSLIGNLESDQNKWKAYDVTLLRKFYSVLLVGRDQRKDTKQFSKTVTPNINCFKLWEAYNYSHCSLQSLLGSTYDLMPNTWLEKTSDIGLFLWIPQVRIKKFALTGF